MFWEEDELEMPVPCPVCEEWCELNSTKESPLTKELLCSNCYSNHYTVNELKEEIDTIQLDLDNNESYMKGDRKGWKANIKENKEKIKTYGFKYEEL